MLTWTVRLSREHVLPIARHAGAHCPFICILRHAAFYVQVEVRRFPQIKGLPSAVIQVAGLIPLMAFKNLLHIWN